MSTPPTPLHLVIAVGPFAKWGIDFMTCHPPSTASHHYIIMVVDYFTKWAEDMSTYLNNTEIVARFIFNHIIPRFGIPKSIVIDHSSHFCNNIMIELATLLKFRHENLTPYYPQANGQVEAINRVLKTMIQRIIGKHKSNWHLALFSTLWAYQTSAKTATCFTPFQLVNGIEAVLPIECEIPSLWLVVELLPNTTAEEERLLFLSGLDEHRRQVAMANKSHKKRTKTLYDRSVRPQIFVEGDLVLVYAQEHNTLGKRKFELMWHGPYVIKQVLDKGSYELVYFEGTSLAEPHNELYLKKYYV
jgi:hypothetical protein